jgi:hypothetical protein
VGHRAKRNQILSTVDRCFAKNGIQEIRLLQNVYEMICELRLLYARKY